MNKSYRIVLSEDEQKILAVVLKKEKLKDLTEYVKKHLTECLLT